MRTGAGLEAEAVGLVAMNVTGVIDRGPLEATLAVEVKKVKVVTVVMLVMVVMEVMEALAVGEVVQLCSCVWAVSRQQQYMLRPGLAAQRPESLDLIPKLPKIPKIPLHLAACVAVNM